MRGRIRTLCLLGGLLAILSTSTGTFADDAPSASPPRYSLPAGRRLTYSIVSETKGDNMSETSSATWEITVVRENADGSRHLIFRVATKRNQAIQGRPIDAPESVTLGAVDLLPDGRLLTPLTPNIRLYPEIFLPLLPSTNADLAAGWSGDEPARLQQTSFSALPPDAKEWSFKAVRGGIMAKVYGVSESATFHFDMDKQIISKVESVEDQTYGFNSTSTDTGELLSDTTVALDDAAQLDKDVEAYTQADKAYDAAADKAMHASADEADAIMDQAKADLAAAAASAKNPDVQAEYQQVLSQHDAAVKYVKDEQAGEQTYLNQTAPDFSTVDMDGNSVKLADLRGKIVVLDFWYRGCGWCMFAMPQIKQIADDFKDKPVAVLGMNTDNDPKDARVVIDVQQLNYPTLKAIGLPEKFGVRGFPTLILIDAAGVVRRIHVGYSPTLRDDIGREIQSLIEEKAAGANP
jgi:peroxiredoxin